MGGEELEILFPLSILGWKGLGRMKKIFGFVFVVGLMVLVGCRDRSAEGIAQEGKGSLIVAATNRYASSLGDSEVLVEVNGVALTKGGFMKEVNLRRALLKAGGKKPQGEAEYAEQMGNMILGQWIGRQLLLGYAKKAGIEVDKGVAAKCAARRRTMFGKKFSTEASTKKALGDLYEEYKRQGNEEDLIGTLWEKKFTVNATEEEISTRLANIVKYNKMVDATNALVRVKGEQVYAKLKAGEDFGKLSDDYSDDPGKEEGGEWGWFLLDKIEGDELKAKIAALKKDEYTAPLDTVYGLMIVKLLETRDGPDGKDKEYHLARILLRLGANAEDVSREEMREMILKRKAKEVQQSVVDGLRKSAALNYPNGTNLFKKASSPFQFMK